METRKSRTAALLAVLVVSLGTAIAAPAPTAAPPSPAPSAAPSSEPARADLAVKTLEEKARRIRALLAGGLDPAIDAADLFVLHAEELDEAELTRLLRRLEAPVPGSAPAPAPTPAGPATGSATPPATPIDAHAAARRELFEARLAFLSLDEARRTRLLSEHAEKRRAARAEADLAEARLRTLATLLARAERLREILAGGGATPAEVDSLLRIDLADGRELALSPERRKRFLSPKQTAASGEPDPGVEARIAAAQNELDRLRAAFAGLAPERRAALLARPAATASPEPAPADAPPEGETALLLATERERWAAANESLDAFEASLAERREGFASASEKALAWSRRVRELSARSMFDRARAADADAMYEELVADLSATRARLRVAIDEVRAPPVNVPTVDLPDLPAISGDADLREARARLRDRQSALVEAEKAARWERASTLRDAMVSMNGDRLRLMAYLDPGTRAALQGFGQQGVAQAKREVEQIRLEVLFHVVSLPRHARAEWERIRAAPLPFLVALAKLAVLIAVFRWWRAGADPFLARLHAGWRRRPETPATRAAVAALGYLRETRRPLEWIALILILGMTTRLFRTPELLYLSRIVLGFLFASVVVHLLHALGARGPDELRYKSLRLVAVYTVSVGVILSLTRATAGTGALHAWVLRGSLLLAVPLGFLLIRWWRDRIHARASREGGSRWMRWVASRRTGAAGLAAAATGGLYFLASDAGRLAVRQAEYLSVTRRFLAYLFRREAERQNLALERAGDRPLDEAARESLSPGRAPARFIEAPATAALEAALAATRVPGTLVAIVGERGIGKSTLLTRLESACETPVCRVALAERGRFDDFLDRLREALGLPPKAAEPEVLTAARSRRLILVDDAQRLVRPEIGGLGDLDRMTSFARQAGAPAAWVFAIGQPAWRFVTRARADRAVFDRAIELAPWREEDIAELVSTRSSAAGLAPRFDRLAGAGARPVAANELAGRFHRFLWDASDGNPLIAQQIWRESLVHAEDGTVFVRMPRLPSAGALEELPESLYFVLRAVVQLEVAGPAEIARCTHLGEPVVADALRSASLQGWIEPYAGAVRIALPWYRAVTRVLRWKHLLT